MRIFNLAEELEKERKINKVLTEEVLKYEMSNKQLQDRIDSAINYVEYSSYCEVRTLLNILKGSKNE